MLDAAQQNLLDQLLKTLSAEQRFWLSGFLAGSGEGAEPAATARPLPIYFATETGNAKRIAQEVAKAAKLRGWRPQAQPINKADFKTLSAQDGFAVFVSATHGEGDPPDAARKFFELMKAEKATDLSKLQYAVLGLGDRAYVQFCQAAVEIDTHMQRLGAKRFADTLLLDVDFDDHIENWLDGLFTKLPANEGGARVAVASAPRKVSGKGYNRLSPVTGTIKEIVNLNDIDSNKETYHLEIAFEDGLTYTPGDSAGIILPAQPDGSVPTPRLYSIASSQAQVGSEVHLTVSHAWHYFPDGSKGFGICSHYLSSLKEGDSIEFYIHRNDLFRLPGDDAPVIMVGPGTGIAPFRAFLQERDARGATGKNWLVFGDQRAHCDFLYQLEMQDYLATGLLSIIDLAFSRDQQEKHYVQHSLQKRAEELAGWLEEGAHLYICGSKSPMSEDVEKTLIDILSQQKKISAVEAGHFLEQLAEDNRYVKDVY